MLIIYSVYNVSLSIFSSFIITFHASCFYEICFAGIIIGAGFYSYFNKKTNKGCEPLTSKDSRI